VRYHLTMRGINRAISLFDDHQLDDDNEPPTLLTLDPYDTALSLQDNKQLHDDDDDEPAPPIPMLDPYATSLSHIDTKPKLSLFKNSQESEATSIPRIIHTTTSASSDDSTTSNKKTLNLNLSRGIDPVKDLLTFGGFGIHENANNENEQNEETIFNIVADVLLQNSSKLMPVIETINSRVREAQVPDYDQELQWNNFVDATALSMIPLLMKRQTSLIERFSKALNVANGGPSKESPKSHHDSSSNIKNELNDVFTDFLELATRYTEIIISEKQESNFSKTIKVS
jgi:hypothetical protein